jgi:hypothetical protein
MRILRTSQNRPLNIHYVGEQTGGDGLGYQLFNVHAMCASYLAESGFSLEPLVGKANRSIFAIIPGLHEVRFPGGEVSDSPR